MAEAPLLPATRLRVIDVLSDAAKLFPKTSSPDGEDYLMDLRLETFLKEAGIEIDIDKFSSEVGFANDFGATDHQKLINSGMTNSLNRIRFLACLKRFINQMGMPLKETHLQNLERKDKDFIRIEKLMQDTIVKHEDDVGGKFTKYHIIQVEAIANKRQVKRFEFAKALLDEDNDGVVEEKTLFHGSLYVNSIVEKGFDIRYANRKSMFGAAHYFAENSSKSNLYVFGDVGSGCAKHDERSCYECMRKLLVCQVLLGRSLTLYKGCHYCHSPPDHDSITGEPSTYGGLRYLEFAVYKDEQTLPTHLVSYKIVRPE